MHLYQEVLSKIFNFTFYLHPLRNKLSSRHWKSHDLLDGAQSEIFKPSALGGCAAGSDWSCVRIDGAAACGPSPAGVADR
jgi:hypothetical protein